MKVAVAGYDIAALIVSRLLSEMGHWVLLCTNGEPDPFAKVSSRPELVKRGRHLLSFLDSFQFEYLVYKTRIGILLNGTVAKYPGPIARDKQRMSAVALKLCTKSRLVGPPSGQRLPNTQGDIPRSTVAFNWSDLIKVLDCRRHPQYMRDSNVITSIEPGVVETSSTRRHFDLVVVTLPLWEVARCVVWEVPHASAVIEHVAGVHSGAEKDEEENLSKYDVVWTPYTPEDLIFKVTQCGSEYRVHFSGRWEDGETNLRLASDLNFLFPSGWSPSFLDKNVLGHRFQLSCSPVWPDGVVPIGKYTVWDEKYAGLESVLYDFERMRRKYKL